MSSIQIFSVGLLIAVLSACANPGIVEVSPDTYLLFREDHAGIFGSMAKLKAGVIRDANEFAANQGKVAIPISSKEKPVGNGPGQWASFEYQFRVVAPDDEEAVRTRLTRDPDRIIQQDGTTKSEITLRADDQNRDTYTELLKLDDLRKRGILTEEEFEEEKRKLLSHGDADKDIQSDTRAEARKLEVFTGPALGAERPSAAAFGKLPPIGGISLSPDGKRAVVLKALQGTYHVAVVDLDAKKTRLVMAADPEEFLYSWCRFANNTRVVCQIHSYGTVRAGQAGLGQRRYRDGRTVMTRLLAVNADGSDSMQLVPRAITGTRRDLVWNSTNQSSVISWLEDDEDHILMQIAREDRIYPTVYRLNIYTNKLSRVKRYRETVLRWYADRHGKLRLAVGYKSLEPVVFIVDERGRLERGDFKHLAGIGAPPQPLAFPDDGKSIIVSANNGQDTRGIYRVNRNTGAVLETIAFDEKYDIYRGLVLHPKSEAPVLVEYFRERHSIRWIDDDFRQQFEDVKSAIPGKPDTVFPVSAAQTFDRFILYSEGNSTVPSYYFYDAEAKSLTLLAQWYNDLGNLVDREPVSYEARDGANIPGYLTLPGPADAGPYPTVLLPHGGPHARDTGAFNYWVQFLVSRGYAVLQPNFRGSSGYGDAYMEAGFNQWGLRMQNDVMDGLDWLVKSQIADPNHVCIMGGSYGGYVALMASIKAADRFRCAVSFAGVTNLEELVRRVRLFRLGEISAARIQDGQLRKANSPIHRVADIGLPLLIIHGDVDRSVMIEQSRELAAALEEAKKPFRYVEQPNGDHFLSLEEHRVQFFQELDTFLARYMPVIETSPTSR